MITIDARRMAELEDKKKFVEDISNVFTHYKRYVTVEKIEYSVFGYAGRIEEYVVITYIGGGVAVANSEGNSISAIYRAIGNLLRGGYYDEVPNYKSKLANSESILVVGA